MSKDKEKPTIEEMRAAVEAAEVEKKYQKLERKKEEEKTRKWMTPCCLVVFVLFWLAVLISYMLSDSIL